MRQRTMLAVGVWLALATPASAWEPEPVQLLTAQLTVPRTAPGTGWPMSHQLGLHLAFPLPSADVSDSELGATAGLSWTGMSSPWFGGGLEFAYHYWPTSADFKAEFNEELRYLTFGLMELGGTTWGLEAFELSAHLTAVAPIGAWTTTWIEVGAGGYQLDLNTTGFQGRSGVFFITMPAFDPLWVGGFNGRVGVDLIRREKLSFGLEVSYDHLLTTERMGSDFRTWAAGIHVGFGR